MLREIKFRAWDIKKTGFIQNFAVIGGSCFVEKNSAPVEDIYIKVIVDGTSETFYRDWATYQKVDAILEQFTELYDKDSKEIFEGDVVEVGVQFPKKEIVFFEKGVFRTKTNALAVFNDTCSIIGNIHENPEMIK